ncbi:hypothetical protein [Roseobacter sinensis]|uniref:Lipoprotein n=1 Tax=Roseobacter sinensis TaxID=2931391 RepID=A0ABT3B9S5_9RHOB|nr:hypothetical protein [Roseobacter sp. WL0113]MCV3270328.1 hypothetical protein [Roseobacter sp. WL0113]
MKFQMIWPLALTVLLGACAETGTGAGGTPIRNLPEEVVAMAAPNQDLTSVRILPEDGCYWYRHVGPVETTLLPLRNAAGQPICTRPQSDTTATGA